jgi:histone H3/H4
VDDAKNFFETIYGAGEGYAVLTNELASKGQFYQYPAELDLMVKYVDAHKNGQVYFSPVLFSEPKREKIYAKTVSVAYADSDVFDYTKYRVTPSLTVETAAGRTHNYWLLDNDYNPHTVALLNRRVHHAHAGEGVDSSYGNAAKILRVPGSINTNRDNAAVRIIANPGTIYTLAQLETSYPDDGIPEKVYGTGRELPSELPDRATVLNKVTDNKYIRNLLFDEPIPGKRSEMRYKLESELFRTGFTAEEVTVLVWDAPCCKYKQEGRPIAQLWKEVLDAEVDPENQPPISRVNEPSPDGDALLAITEVIDKANFLTDAERASLKVTFIDLYEQWASSKTTSPGKYHRMAALMLMSVIYAEFGHIPFEFEKTKLNVWVMLLGNTTVDRKTTALKYMTDILEDLETPDYQYDIGSDATKQGLNKLLADRPHQSSLLHADEVQDVFMEVFSAGYLTGLVGYWTQLYSGKSSGVVRSTGDKLNTKAVPVNFMMYMTGIVTHVAEALTVKHFESGFLTRFLYCLVEPRPYDPAGDTLKQSPATTNTYVDPVRTGLMNHLAGTRNHWSMKVTRENTAVIRFSDPALARMNEFQKHVKGLIVASPRFETLKGPIERLIISVAKCAALFAMDDKRDTIEVSDVLAAIDLAEEWYNDLQKIAAMISESNWQSDINKLEQIIVANGGRLDYGRAYKQFTDKRPQEFKELADGLEDMGRISQTRQGNKTLLEIEIGSE